MKHHMDRRVKSFLMKGIIFRSFPEKSFRFFPVSLDLIDSGNPIFSFRSAIRLIAKILNDFFENFYGFVILFLTNVEIGNNKKTFRSL